MLNDDEEENRIKRTMTRREENEKTQANKTSPDERSKAMKSSQKQQKAVAIKPIRGD